MADFVTLAQAHAHLNPSFALVGGSPLSAQESDLQLKLDAAEFIVLDYLKVGSPLPWTDELDVPPIVHAAILLQLGELWRFRGDDPDGNSGPQTAGDLSPSITNLLRRYRDPALA